MQTVNIECKTKNEGGAELSATVSYEMPESLPESIQKYGEDLVFKTFLTQLTTNVKNTARAALRDGEDAQKAAADYVLGERKERAPVDPVQQMMRAWAKMTDVERAEWIAKNS